MTDQAQLSLEQVLDIVTRAYSERRIAQSVRRDGDKVVSTMEIVIDDGASGSFDDALGLIGVASV